MYQTNYRLNFLFPVQLMLNDTDGVYNFSGMVELQVTLGPGFGPITEQHEHSKLSAG